MRCVGVWSVKRGREEEVVVVVVETNMPKGRSAKDPQDQMMEGEEKEKWWQTNSDTWPRQQGINRNGDRVQRMAII